MIIVYLPPDDINNYIPFLSHNSIKPSKMEFTVIRVNKSYKGGGLLIYKVEYRNHNDLIIPENINSNNMNTNTMPINKEDATANATMVVSSQAFDEFYIKKLYTELNFQPINQIFSAKNLNLNNNFTASHNVNIFGVVLGVTCTVQFNVKCCCVIMYDFNINDTICVRLWRGLAAWINSLSIGCRLQIRNLISKSTPINELHSTSITEIYLLGHGHLGVVPLDLRLSARGNCLNFKEREILEFLNQQSLHINYTSKSTEKTYNYNFVSLNINFPLNLEWQGSFPHNHNCCWILTGGNENLPVHFIHFDAKVWQILSEAFLNQSSEQIQSVSFDKLNRLEDHYEFTNVSSVSFTFAARTTLLSLEHTIFYKKLTWDDLISCSVVLFGFYQIEGIVSSINSLKTRSNDNIKINNNQMSMSIENSIGVLSILPDESIETESNHQFILRSSNNFVYLENTNKSISPLDFSDPPASIHLILVKTILNDGNVDEIVRKSVWLY